MGPQEDMMEGALGLTVAVPSLGRQAFSWETGRARRSLGPWRSCGLCEPRGQSQN